MVYASEASRVDGGGRERKLSERGWRRVAMDCCSTKDQGSLYSAAQDSVTDSTERTESECLVR